ncbi:MAG: site-specific integrase [Euryarchaeota archaeon]|nr:site-specific integrase [Euryarchaeota archaeon]
MDIEAGTIFTEHVKGEDSYGEPRTSIIHPDGIPFLKRYLKVRNDVIVRRNCLFVVAIFPAIREIRTGGDGYLSSNSLTKMREIVTADSGVVFDLRACRRTFGQTAVDQKVPIDAVSRLMGHASTTMTEKAYCRKKGEAAINDAQKALSIGVKTEQKTEVAQNVAGSPGQNLPPYKKISYEAGYA